MRDMWDELRDESRPILIYGMGNGADKLIAKFEELNIPYADIFASDGFVRGHSFRGFRVKSFSEVKEQYPDFVIVLSFASNREEVIDMLSDIDSSYDMYVPDMPVAGVEEYFDKNFYNTNYKSIKEAYELFCDDDSRNCFASVVCYKLFGKMKYLLGAASSREEKYSLINSYADVVKMVDCGAYNGDTVIEAMRFFSGLKSVIAVEPDPRNYKKLLRFSDGVEQIRIEAHNLALWSECGEGEFSGSGNRNSSIGATSSFEYREEQVRLASLDSLVTDRVDYIKYDVEGAEAEALLGSVETISRYKPTLLVSLYHRSRDIFALPIYIKNTHPEYRFYLRRKRCLPAWELELIAFAVGT